MEEDNNLENVILRDTKWTKEQILQSKWGLIERNTGYQLWKSQYDNYRMVTMQDTNEQVYSIEHFYKTKPRMI